VHVLTSARSGASPYGPGVTRRYGWGVEALGACRTGGFLLEREAWRDRDGTVRLSLIATVSGLGGVVAVSRD
jgi:hypothetical protein